MTDHDSPGITAIVAERLRQVDAEGYSPDHDEQHVYGEMALAAACYALPMESGPLRDQMLADLWPWRRVDFRPTDRRRDLVKAGALIVAEIDRLDRSETVDTETEETLTAAYAEVATAQAALASAVTAACPGPHETVQHRDMKPPWCRACGRDSRGQKIGRARA